MIQTIILVFMGIIATLVALLVGLLSFIVLKLMKKELNLKITIGANPPKKNEG
jgi:uncharacterized protein YneF (UPF0154 family)